MSYIYNLTDTWNAAGTTFAGIKMAVTNTASDGSSKLLDLTVSGSTTGSFSVDKSANLNLSGSITGPLHIGGTGTTSSLTLRSTSGVGTTGADIIFQIGNNGATEGMRLANNGGLGIGTAAPSVSLEIVSAVSGAPNIRLRNSNSGGFTGAQLSDESGSLIAHFGYGGSTTGLSNRMYFGTIGVKPLVLTTSDAERLRIDSSGNVIINTAAIATNATNGFLYVPTCAGLPTGTPTAYAGRAPIVVDSTNNKLYFYSNGAWRDAGP